MDDNRQKQINSLMRQFMHMKKMQFQNILCMDNLSSNEKTVLILIYKNSNNEKVLLSILREHLKLAPSTITPIITLLENKGYIEREIDKEDRRNIFLKLTKKGIEYTTKAHIDLNKRVNEYIEYIGEKDIEKLIDLLNKTSDFFESIKEGE